MSSEGTPSIIECPECLAKLRLRNAPTPGKKIICPKCQTTFVVGDEPAPVAEVARPAAKKAAPPPEEDLEEEERPLKPKRKKKKGKGSGANLGLIIGLSIGGLLLVGALFVGYRLVVNGAFGGLFGSKQEAMIQSYISNMEEMTTVLESVKDENSAIAAAPKIATIASKVAALRKSLQEVKVAKMESDRLKKKYEDKINRLIIRLGTAVMNAGRIGGRVPAFVDAVMKMQSLSSF